MKRGKISGRGGEMGVNREYKDSVFTWLFSDPEVLRELYGALGGVEVPLEVPIKVNTLEGVLYKGLRNDISFEVGGKVVILVEHQSTINPNMGLRLLLYLARVYEKITGERSLYSGKLVKIPRPELYVLYNGTEGYPDESILRLSDAYEEGGSLAAGDTEPDLELKVKVYNINEGRNEGLVGRSKTLWGYREFIGKVREYERASGDIGEGMKRAIEYCIGHGVLREFLRENGTEVRNMLLTEWDWDKAIAIQREESKQDGWEEGHERGREDGLEEGLEQGREEGREEGRGDGLEEAAKNALAAGLGVDMVEKITGLSREAIQELAGLQG